MPLKNPEFKSGLKSMKVIIEDLQDVENAETDNFGNLLDVVIVYAFNDGSKKVTFKSKPTQRQRTVKNWSKQFKVEEYDGQELVKYNGYQKEFVILTKIANKIGRELTDFNSFIGMEFDAKVATTKESKEHFIDWTTTLIVNNIEIPGPSNPDVYRKVDAFAGLDSKKDIANDLPF